MKKIIIAALVLIGIAIGVYLFIPSDVTVNARNGGLINARAMRRMLFEEANWNKWWPDNNRDSSGFVFNGVHYRIKDKLISSLIIEIKGKELSTTSSLTLIPVQEDSVEVNWQAVLPVKNKLGANSEAKKIEDDIAFLTDHLFDKLKNPVNIYGVVIEHASVKDSTLISTFSNIDHYPSTNEVYSLIDEIKSYAKQNSAIEMGHPMLNITERGLNDYILRVAIPVNKVLPSKGNISYKWMLGGGNILVADVTGTQSKLEQALKAMDDYVSDTRMNAPAIAYFSLVSDRRALIDSNRWVTRIYYPVM